MYLGTLSNGEKILLFSSAQINYVRYWLYTVGLTKNIIPLPYSDCLLTDADLKQVTTICFKTGGQLKMEHKSLDKVNKKIKKGAISGGLSNKRDTFENIRTHWQAKQGTWLAIDIEAWDYMHDEMTEFGWSGVYWDDGKEVEARGHYRIKEYEHTRQTFVPNHQDKYQFGKTEFIMKKDKTKHIGQLFSQFTERGPVFLIFHGAGNDKGGDLKSLKNIKVIEDYVFPTKDIPKSGYIVVDTQELFQALEGHESGNTRSLGQVCNQLQIRTQWLHNAGNDAHYTFLALKEMASGDPVDQQRTKRWPQQSAGLTADLKHKPVSEEYSDDEDIMMGPPAPPGTFDE